MEFWITLVSQLFLEMFKTNGMNRTFNGMDGSALGSVHRSTVKGLLMHVLPGSMTVWVVKIETLAHLLHPHKRRIGTVVVHTSLIGGSMRSEVICLLCAAYSSHHRYTEE